jgi:O-glycosyl hydrolase
MLFQKVRKLLASVNVKFHLMTPKRKGSDVLVRSVLLTLFALQACSQNSTNENSREEIQNHVTIHTDRKKQTIRNFGASDAWTIQYVGLWPDEKRNQIADWLFSMEEDADGKPKGIGLSLWRFNIGAGSARHNDISDEWRRAEGFLTDDLSYDWSRQAGQRWMMGAARNRGVKEFVAFTNSPPVQLTKNGKAFSSNGAEANITPNNYLRFSKFLVDVVKHLRSENIPVNYVSPFNEPQWDWTGNNQEGSPYRNSEIHSITRILDSLITAESMDFQIQIAEAGKLNYLCEHADKPGRGDQIVEFFDKKSLFYLGDLPHVDKVISGHSYFTSAPVEQLVDVRRKVSDKILQASIPIEFWQSEYCILGDQEEVKAVGKDTGIDPALYVARIIHHDLTVANASAWHWWLAVTAYDYKDGLIYVEKNKTTGTIEDTKLLWALGNFSRFIRPGAQRLEVTASGLNANNPNGLMISSYVNTINNKIIAVIINYANTESSITINTEGNTVQQWKPYITGKDPGEKLKPLSMLPGNDPLKIPPRSIVTLVED